jgi:hypothetical protein
VVVVGEVGSRAHPGGGVYVAPTAGAAATRAGTGGATAAAAAGWLIACAKAKAITLLIIAALPPDV